MDGKEYSLNYKKDLDDPRDFLLESVILKKEIKLSDYPRAINYTNDMSTVKDQGNLGSCVAFAIVAMKEWQEKIEHELEVEQGKQYRRNKQYWDYSEQWLYRKTKEIDPWPNEEGTSLRYALKILSTIGVPCEKAWTYCDENIGKPESWATMISLWALGGHYFRIRTVEEMVQTLTNIGPFPIGIVCFKEIFNVGLDMNVSMPTNPNQHMGGHAICVVGYDIDHEFFMFKNSWGTSWGNGGYGRISFEYTNKYLLDAWAMKDISVTRDMLKRDNR